MKITRNNSIVYFLCLLLTIRSITANAIVVYMLTGGNSKNTDNALIQSSKNGESSGSIAFQCGQTVHQQSSVSGSREILIDDDRNCETKFKYPISQKYAQKHLFQAILNLNTAIWISVL